MPPVRFSQRAVHDLTRFHEFLAGKNEDAARRALEAIEHGVRALGTFTEMGRPVNAQSPEVREWVIPFGQGAYLALYRVDGEQIVILAMRHGREDVYGDESPIE